MTKPTEKLDEIIDLEPSENRMNKVIKPEAPEDKTKNDTKPILIKSLIVFVIMAFISICLRCIKYINPLCVYIFY